MSDELRDLLKRRAENVSVPSDDLGSVVRGGQRRKWRNRLYTTGVAALVGLVTWASVPALLEALRDEDQTPPPITNTPTPTPSPTERDFVQPGRCENGVPFRPTSLPDEWSYELQPGAGGQGDTPVDKQSPQALGHYSAIKGEGAWIDVLLYGSYYTLPPGEGEVIKVLNGKGRIGQVHEGGWTVEFAYRGCDYSLTTYAPKVRGNKLERIARGLQPADTCKPKVIRGEVLPVEDGRHFGYIKALNGVEMTFDEAEFLSGDEANQAAIEAGIIEEGDTVPNDYFIRNEDKTRLRLQISRDVQIFVDSTSMDGMVGPAPADIRWLWCALTSKEPIDMGHAHSPYWIDVTDGIVTRIEEQYLP